MHISPWRSGGGHLLLPMTTVTALGLCLLLCKGILMLFSKFSLFCSTLHICPWPGGFTMCSRRLRQLMSEHIHMHQRMGCNVNHEAFVLWSAYVLTITGSTCYWYSYFYKCIPFRRTISKRGSGLLLQTATLASYWTLLQSNILTASVSFDHKLMLHPRSRTSFFAMRMSWPQNNIGSSSKQLFPVNQFSFAFCAVGL